MINISRNFNPGIFAIRIGVLHISGKRGNAFDTLDRILDIVVIERYSPGGFPLVQLVAHFIMSAMFCFQIHVR